MAELAGLHVTFLAGTLGQGGAERQLFYMIRALKQAGALPRVLTLASGEFWEEHLVKLGVPVVCVGGDASRMRRVKNILNDVRCNPPDILQSLHFYTNLYVGMCGALSGVRTLGSMRGDGWSDIQSSGRVAGTLCLYIPRRIAANSKEAIRFAQRKGVPPDHLILLSNAVDTENFVPIPRQESRTVRLLAIGRLHPKKRYDRFIRLIARLRSYPDIEVKGTIVGVDQGSQSLKNDLENEARSLGLLPEALEFCKAASDAAPVYQNTDIHLLTSDSEGTPNVTLEAMSCGLPVVATRVGGVADIIHDGVTGFLIDPPNEQMLLQVVLQLIRNPQMRRAAGERARQYVVQHHSIVQLAPRLAEVYDRVLAHPNAKGQEPCAA